MIGFAELTNMQCAAGISGRAAETMIHQAASRAAIKAKRRILSLIVLILSAAPALAVSGRGANERYATGATPPIRFAQNGSASAIFLDVVRLVERQGWRTSLGDMCTKFWLPAGGNDCSFLQLSVQETEGRGDPRGLNVSVSPNSGTPYVLIFHLNPLVGEFFVVSPDGALLRVFVRFKGADYKRISNEEVREEFNKDIAYWMGNFVRLKSALEAERSGNK